ncbi:hypothetical protein SLA2020_050350 [Shorea laevis]
MLEVKKHTIIFTNEQVNFQGSEEVVYSNHITKCDESQDELQVEENVEEALSTFEDGNQATMDELKEINLGTLEYPHPIFLNAN